MIVEIESHGVSKDTLETLVCAGCCRTTDEIKTWARLSDREKVKILDKIILRKNENKTKTLL